ncbi:restriction endonuclease [Microaerobacter geothermalis]|uniref:restriction endonuclease n=1 Tax=Microaerobacter geothermalis TaxID=674972 RepID=UPI001F3AC686|nr:restriction endonuclease [Microaerobacter geothermalis]MCF6094869.1 restriction endonuclease [Microaerobacter geothermalis]
MFRDFVNLFKPSYFRQGTLMVRKYRNAADRERDWIRRFVRTFNEEFKIPLELRKDGTVHHVEVSDEPKEHPFLERAVRDLQGMLYQRGSYIDLMALRLFINEEIQEHRYSQFAHLISKMLGTPANIESVLKLYVSVKGGRDSLSEEVRKSWTIHNLIRFIEENFSKEDLENQLHIKYSDWKKKPGPLLREMEYKMEMEIRGQLIQEILLERRPVKPVTLEDIDQMGDSGKEFERFLGMLFEKMGYQVAYTKTTGDQGGDLILERLEEKIVVQAKNVSAPVGNYAIQEVYAAKGYYGCHTAAVITNRDFTSPARELAEHLKVKLVNREQLAEWIERFWNREKTYWNLVKEPISIEEVWNTEYHFSPEESKVN